LYNEGICVFLRST